MPRAKTPSARNGKRSPICPGRRYRRGPFHGSARLARSLEDLRPIVRTFTDQGIMIEFVKEHLTFTGDDAPMAVLLLSMMGAVAHSSGHPTVCSQHLRLDGGHPRRSQFLSGGVGLVGSLRNRMVFSGATRSRIEDLLRRGGGH